jgi:uncharacterized membrane protein
MNCLYAALGLLFLLSVPLALAAFLRSRTNSAAVARLEVELARLRELLERVAPSGGAAAPARPTATPQPPPPLPATPLVPAAPAVPILPEAAAIPVAVPVSAACAGATPTSTPGSGAGAPLPAAAARPAPLAAFAAAPAAAQAARAQRHAAWEELVGARLLLWVGAMALALAGAFLVKISFERGWISPPVRVAMGVAFGVALLALSEALRRSSGRISEALAAAGIADLFACFLAAVHLYHLIPPAAGFALMALTTAVAVGLALRQGVMVALLGLVGGFLTPALIQTDHPSARNLFGYLLLLTAGLLAAAWRRGWRWLSYAALGGGLLWAAAWLGGYFRPGDEIWLSLFLIAMAVTATLPPVAAPSSHTPPAARSPLAGAPTSRRLDRPAPLLAITAALALLAGTVARSGYTPAEWSFLGLLAAGVLALAWLDPRYLALAWLAAAVVVVLLADWGGALTAADWGRFLVTAVAAGGLFAVAGWAAALAGSPRWRRPPGWLGLPGGPATAPSRLGEPGSHAARDAPAALAEPEGRGDPPEATRAGADRSGTWAALSAAAGVVFFLVAWGSAHALAGWRPAAWGGIALAAAALYLAGAVPVARRRHEEAEEPAGPQAAGERESPRAPGDAAGATRGPWSAGGSLTPALAALAVAVTSLVSLAVPLALERESLAAAWALEVVALVWLAGRFCLPALIVLARLLALAAVLGAFFSDAQRPTQGGPPVFDELLYAYGVPLLALAAAAWLARRESLLSRWPGRALTSPARLASELEWEAVVLGFWLLTLEVHHLFQPAVGAPLSLAEAAAIANAWLLLGWALLWGNRRMSRRSLELAGRLVILLGLAATLFGPGLGVNPLWDHQPVGSTPLLNLLVVAYALPAGLALAATSAVRRHGGRRLPRLASLTALMLGFLWISLEVRQLFHGVYLDRAPASPGERYAYSAAWVLYGLALLLAGIARRGPILRYGSLAVMLLAILKVFLYDTARLSDLFRVLSFLGLGASLLLLAFLYQRFVFREGAA